MVLTKMVLVTTITIIVSNLIAMCSCSNEQLLSGGSLSQQHQQQTNENSMKIEDFKNKGILLKRTNVNHNLMPDVSSLTKLSDNKKLESLNGLLLVLDSLNGGNVEVTKDVPFTIIVPKIDVKNIETERLKEFMLEHLIPGEAITSFNEEDVFGNSNKHEIIFKKLDKVNESMWTLNGFKILRTAVLNEKLSTIFIDGMLTDRKAAFSKRNIQETNRYNEPQRLEMKNVTKEEMTLPRKEQLRHSPLMTFLQGMKSGTKVFQHFLSKSNLTQVLDDSPYTILIPSDNAFQRWHPIDWGFYPFSVQEFTENILKNHFLQLKTPLRMEDVMDMDRGHKYKTLGGEVVVFKNHPTPSVNNVSILADFTLPNGNEVFLISEVLFVSEAVVSRLHQMHKDKETPPLLAFPWFGAQFLSHSFLALERDSRFSQITRFLNTAEIAQYVSGANYTFFVPIDEAFEKLGYDLLSDDVLGSDRGIKMLLNHFVRGRLYDRDLKNDEVFETIGGGALRIQRQSPGNVTVNRANIIESEVFVYNLGTMFYIDQILYADILTSKSDLGKTPSRTNQNYKYSTLPDVEAVPSEFTEQNGTEDDFLLQDDEIVTPRALPVAYNIFPKK